MSKSDLSIVAELAGSTAGGAVGALLMAVAILLLHLQAGAISGSVLFGDLFFLFLIAAGALIKGASLGFVIGLANLGRPRQPRTGLRLRAAIKARIASARTPLGSFAGK